MGRASTLRIVSEHAEQKALIDWARLQTKSIPELGMLYAIPNGGERNVIVASKLKAEGVKAGVPDLCLPVPRGEYHGLYIELKRRKRSRVTLEQSAWLGALRRQGYRAEICKGWDEARELITDYLSADCWISAESMARRFHEIYEAQSKAFGYTTRDDTKEFDPNSPNGRLMIFTCAQMLKGPEALKDD